MSIKTILIIEDLAHVMQWLKQSCKFAYPDAHLSHAVNLSDAIEQVKNKNFDLALIDIGLPDGSGLEVVDYLYANNPSTTMVISTIFDDDQHLFNALRKGANGYILKDQDKDQLAQMLINIEKGHMPISASIANKLLNFFNPQLPKVKLTNREKDVLTLIAKGFKIPEVSGSLGIKNSTCYGYVKDIYRKLDINSRAQATLEATKMGLIDHNL